MNEHDTSHFFNHPHAQHDYGYIGLNLGFDDDDLSHVPVAYAISDNSSDPNVADVAAVVVPSSPSSQFTNQHDHKYSQEVNDRHHHQQQQQQQLQQQQQQEQQQQDRVPESFKCPISGKVMQDPVILSDGLSYER